jgi:hypothetical protein
MDQGLKNGLDTGGAGRTSSDAHFLSPYILVFIHILRAIPLS